MQIKWIRFLVAVTPLQYEDDDHVQNIEKAGGVNELEKSKENLSRVLMSEH